jgi:hypothetical protein
VEIRNFVGCIVGDTPAFPFQMPGFSAGLLWGPWCSSSLFSVLCYLFCFSSFCVLCAQNCQFLPQYSRHEWGSCSSIFSFMCMFVDCCLSFCHFPFAIALSVLRFKAWCSSSLFSVLCYLFCFSSFCVLCAQNCQFLWTIHSWFPFAILQRSLKPFSSRIFIGMG